MHAKSIFQFHLEEKRHSRQFDRIFSKNQIQIRIKNVIFFQLFSVGTIWFSFCPVLGSFANHNIHTTIYSATTFLEKCRKVVLEKCFCKLGFFFWSTTFLQPEKRWIYGIKPPFFLVNHFSRTRFLEPDFLNHFSRTTFLHFSRKVVAE